MCGIAGVVSLGAPIGEEDRALAQRMTRALGHRGPDGARVLADEAAALGTARLRVTDLSPAADLPLESEDGSLRLAYNGAVTNFRALREELRLDEERPLRTRSDAEVVLRLYERLGEPRAGAGEPFLARLSGQFAFALHDRTRRRLLLVRDFFGLRPVFHLTRGDRLYFASEIQALLEVPGWDRRLDREALWHFFSLAYIPGRRTPFAEVRELPAGHLLDVDLRAGRVVERRHYAPSFAPDESLTEEAAARGVREALRDAVARSLDCDVPAGLTLSGGVDTSCLLALAKELGLSRRLHTFSLRVDEASFDESRYQRIMVDFARPIHHEIRVGPEEVEAAFESTVAHLGEPSGDGAAVPTFLLAREARRRVRVLLSGEGGDEIFGAYETHRVLGPKRLYGALPAWARASLRALAARLPVSHAKLSVDFLAKRFTEGAELAAPEAHLFWRQALGEDEKRRLLAVAPPERPTAALFRELFDSLPGPDELGRLAAVDLAYYFVDDLMVKNDRTVMAHSVETRFPYMERPVAELALRLPSRFKVRGLRGRLIQKRAMRGLVPEMILARANMGLEMPHSRWFFGGLRGLAERRLTRERVERTGLLRHAEVRRLWDEHLSRRRDNGRALWCILSFLAWFDLYVAEGNYKERLQAPS